MNNKKERENEKKNNDIIKEKLQCIQRIKKQRKMSINLKYCTKNEAKMNRKINKIYAKNKRIKKQKELSFFEPFLVGLIRS